MHDIWRQISNGILITFRVLYNILICNVKWIHVRTNCGIYSITDSLNYSEMTSHIYHTEGDFVVWFEIHVLPLSLLKNKTQQKTADEGCV